MVLFDRSRAWDGNAPPEPNAYFCSGRAETVFFTYQLVDEQQDELIRFLTIDGDAETGTDTSTTAAAAANN